MGGRFWPGAARHLNQLLPAGTAGPPWRRPFKCDAARMVSEVQPGRRQRRFGPTYRSPDYVA